MSALLVCVATATGCGGADSPAASVASAPTTVAPPTIGASPAAGLVSADAQLAYQRNGIVIGDVSGQEMTVAPEVARGEHPDWSPNGASIAVETDFSTIWSVTVDGGAAVTIATCDDPCVHVAEPAWSPDGDEIAFARIESDDGVNTTRSSIEVVTVSNGETRSVFEDTTGTRWTYTPRWSPDGASIVFTESTFASARLEEEEVVAERVAVVLVGDAPAGPRYLTADDERAVVGDWSPRADLIVFSRDDNLFTIRPDGTAESAITSYDGEQEHAIQPTFLPDGAGIVFTYVSGEFGIDDVTSAAVIATDGGPVQVLDLEGAVTHPRFRPEAP